jgi:CBS domain-containing protein
MRVKDVMTKKVVGVRPQASVAEAVDLMLASHVSGLPVIEDGRLVGLISEADLIRRVEMGTQGKPAGWLSCLVHPGRLAEDYARTHARRVEEIMTRDVATIGPEALLEEAASRMEERGVRRLPVVSEDKVVGIVARADFVRALAGFLRPSYDQPLTSDAEIRRRILAELDAQAWAPNGLVEVEVAGGIVELHGALTDETQRTAVRVLAENVEGVRGVHDHLTWVEPFSGTVLLSPEDSGRAA